VESIAYAISRSKKINFYIVDYLGRIELCGTFFQKNGMLELFFVMFNLQASDGVRQSNP